MKPIDLENYKLEPVKVDERTRSVLLGLLLFVLFIIICCGKPNSSHKKGSNSSFGSFKDFQIEYVKEENIPFRKCYDDCLLSEFRDNPSSIYELTSRGFEELIAYLYMRQGYDVLLTPATKDGGKDIVARCLKPTGETSTYYIECKRYRQDRPIGVSTVRELAGVMINENVDIGVIITTSRFSQDARNLVQRKKHPIVLKELMDIIELLA